MTKPNKQSVITNKNLRYIIILLNPALRLSVRHFALDGRDFDIAESVSKENFDECDRADVFMLNHPYDESSRYNEDDGLAAFEGDPSNRWNID